MKSEYTMHQYMPSAALLFGDSSSVHADTHEDTLDVRTAIVDQSLHLDCNGTSEQGQLLTRTFG